MRRLLILLGLTAVVFTAALRYDLAAHREFDADEFQHLHAAWCLSHGLVPYADFYEHHMPALPMLLATAAPVGSAGASPADLVRVLCRARVLMWLWSLAVVGLTWALGRQLPGTPATGAVASTLLTFSIIFTGKSLEIRPDGPATAGWLLSLLLMIVALERAGAPRRWRFFWSGLAFGIALLFTQKLLMAGPGLAAVAVWTWWTRGAQPRRPVLLDAAAQATGLTVPLAAMFTWFYARGGGGAFLASTLLQNLRWVQETSAKTTLAWFATRDPMLMLLGVAGAVHVATTFRSGDRRAPAVVMLCGGASLVFGLFLMPAPYPQYLLPALPLLAIFAADLALSASARERSTGARLSLLTAFAFCLAWARPLFMAPWVYPAVFTVMLLLASTLVQQRPSIAVATVLVAASLYQVQQMRWMQGLTDTRQLAAMTVVQRLTDGDHPAVLDGFTGFGWFRPHAWKYHFLHLGVRARLSDVDRQELASGLRSRRIAPGAVLFDADLQAVSKGVDAAVRDMFEPTGTPPVWVPRRDASEEAHPRPERARPAWGKR